MKKNLVAQIWVKPAKIELESKFLFSQVLFFNISSFAYNDSMLQYLRSTRGKPHQKNLGDLNLGQNQAQNLTFCHFLKFGLLVLF